MWQKKLIIQKKTIQIIKMVKDRRRGDERRSEKRYTINMDIEWEGLIGRQNGTMSDISLLGCFVLCSGEVENGEIVKLYIPIANGMKAQFLGKVVNHVFEIGFGVEFINLNNAQKEFLVKLLKTLS